MTPSDFRNTLESLGLSQVGASRLFGVTDRIVRMWIAGDRPVPVLVGKVLSANGCGQTLGCRSRERLVSHGREVRAGRA
jgi:hypothetical protein